MLLTIHDANLKKVAFVDNEKQSTLHYFDDIWTRNLETGSSTFEFTVFKKATDKTYNYLNEKAFVSFEYNGKSYVFNVMTVEENEQTITCYCENLNLELINEFTNTYKATNAMSFVEYCNAMGLLNYTYLSVGINEISDQKRTLEWDGQDTKLARLLSLAKKFDAEIDFDTRLNTDSSIKSFNVNVYHKNDGTHQGVGRIRNDIQLTYGKNLKSITRTIDKTNVVNAIRPTGTKDGNTVVISGLSAWEEKNEDSVVEFYQKGEMLYAPISMQMYPSTFTHSTISDQWTRKDITVDSDNPTVIRSAGIRELKKNAYPAITYDVDGFVDLDIGDTVKIHDDGFNPILLIEARVADQKISFTNPDNNKTTFANFTALENRLSDDIQARLNDLVEKAKPYTIKLSTDNGVVFKNNIGQSIVAPRLYKGGQPIGNNVTWRWALDGAVTTGMTYTVLGSNVTDTATLTVSAYLGNDEVATDEVSFVNVFDGTDGVAGKDGKGITGTVITYGISANETTQPTNWTASVPTLVKGQYFWTKTVWTYTDNTNETGYSVAKMGADGQTPYIHWAYSDNADGTGLTTSDNGQRYIGHCSDYTQADSMDKTKYKWADRWAKIEVGGKNVIRNSAFSNAIDGSERFTVGGVTYINKLIPNWNNLYNGGIPNPTTSYHAIYRGSFEGKSPVIEFNESDGSRNWKALISILQASDLISGNYTFSADIYATGTGTRIWYGFNYYNKSGVRNLHSGQTTNYITTINEWHRVSGNIKLNNDIDFTKEVKFYIYSFSFTSNSILYLTKPQLEKGTVPTPYGESQSDIDERIETKADQALTQQQLNMLIEKAQLMQTELQAKASMETLSALERAYMAYVEANDKAVAKSEADLIEAGRRVDAMVETLGGLSKTKKFIDTYIKEAEEGIIIGTNDNVSQIRVTYDRIAMYSAGKEVMYISQGVIHIDNGIFTKSLQVGRFRTEQHQTNLDINVCRYVG